MAIPKLPEDEQEKVFEMGKDIDEMLDAISALEETGLDLTVTKNDLLKMKKARNVMVDKFTDFDLEEENKE